MDRSDPAGLTLDRQLCFALYSTSRAMTARYRQGLEELGLTYSQYLVMLVLWEQGPTTMAVLCELLHLDSGTLSPLLKRLERQGSVTRRRRTEDERSVEVTPTAAGAQLYERACEVQARVERATGMDAAELAGMREQLLRLAARLREVDDAAEAG